MVKYITIHRFDNLIDKIISQDKRKELFDLIDILRCILKPKEKHSILNILSSVLDTSLIIQESKDDIDILPMGKKILIYRVNHTDKTLEVYWGNHSDINSNKIIGDNNTTGNVNFQLKIYRRYWMGTREI